MSSNWFSPKICSKRNVHFFILLTFFSFVWHKYIFSQWRPWVCFSKCVCVCFASELGKSHKCVWTSVPIPTLICSREFPLQGRERWLVLALAVLSPRALVVFSVRSPPLSPPRSVTWLCSPVHWRYTPVTTRLAILHSPFDSLRFSKKCEQDLNEGKVWTGTTSTCNTLGFTLKSK